MHVFRVLDHLTGSDAAVRNHDSDRIVSDFETFARQQVRPSEGIAADFEGVNAIDLTAGQALAALFFRFRSGLLTEGLGTDEAVYLGLRNLTATDARDTIHYVFLHSDLRPRLVFPAPRAVEPTQPRHYLRHHTVGRWRTVERTERTFSVLWSATTLLSPQAIQSELNSEKDRRQVYADLTKLYGQRLVARVERASYVAIR
jgi:hypothetical protein